MAVIKRHSAEQCRRELSFNTCYDGIHPEPRSSNSVLFATLFCWVIILLTFSCMLPVILTSLFLLHTTA